MPDTIAPGAEAVHLYSAPGTYLVTVKDTVTAIATQKSITITTAQPPVFTIADVANQPMWKRATIVSIASGRGELDWGDDSTPDTVLPDVEKSHIFASDGDYTVTLHDRANNVEASTTITVEQPPASPVFTMMWNSYLAGMHHAIRMIAKPETYKVNWGDDTPEADLLPASWYDDWGDANGWATDHIYATPGTYSVTLTDVRSEKATATVSFATRQPNGFRFQPWDVNNPGGPDQWAHLPDTPSNNAEVISIDWGDGNIEANPPWSPWYNETIRAQRSDKTDVPSSTPTDTTLAAGDFLGWIVQHKYATSGTFAASILNLTTGLRTNQAIGIAVPLPPQFTIERAPLSPSGVIIHCTSCDTPNFRIDWDDPRFGVSAPCAMTDPHVPGDFGTRGDHNITLLDDNNLRSAPVAFRAYGVPEFTVVAAPGDPMACDRNITYCETDFFGLALGDEWAGSGYLSQGQGQGRFRFVNPGAKNILVHDTTQYATQAIVPFNASLPPAPVFRVGQLMSQWATCNLVVDAVTSGTALIDWGDGSAQTLSGPGVNVQHAFGSWGYFTISVYDYADAGYWRVVSQQVFLLERQPHFVLTPLPTPGWVAVDRMAGESEYYIVWFDAVTWTTYDTVLNVRNGYPTPGSYPIRVERVDARHVSYTRVFTW